VTAALVGFLGVVVGLAVGFGYRFWSTRREELMTATIATTLLRDAVRASQREADARAALLTLWEVHRAALIRLITPTDYEVLSRAIETSDGGLNLVVTLERLTTLFWSEHQAFILTPLAKYLSRDDLSAKASRIIREPDDQSV
jgi:hypothetical protein